MLLKTSTLWQIHYFLFGGGHLRQGYLRSDNDTRAYLSQAGTDLLSKSIQWRESPLVMRNMTDQTKAICIISFPWASPAPYIFLSNLLEILDSLPYPVVLVDGNTDRIDIPGKKVTVKDIGIGIYYFRKTQSKRYSDFLFILKMAGIQLKTSWELLKLSNKVSLIIFYGAYPYYLVPVLVAKLLRLKTIEIVNRSRKEAPKSLVEKLLKMQERAIMPLFDYICPQSPSLISQKDSKAYARKILPVGARYVPDSFTSKSDILTRKRKVGYIGRVSEEKGIQNFMQAIPAILHQEQDIEFIVGGDGLLLNKLKKNFGRADYPITFTGWLSRERTITQLNELKLLVLPTEHAEGLPTIVLEAMACGTPVLASPAGGIVDVIADGQTGFILPNNSPSCITKRVLSALNWGDLQVISRNGQKLVELNYRKNSAIERYNKIIELALQDS